MSGIRLGCESQEIGTGAQADFQFCGLPVRLDPRSSQAYPRKTGSSKLQNQFPSGEDQLFSKTTHVLDRPSHCNGKIGSFWTSPHETHPMAPKEPLAHPGIFGGHTDSQVPSSPPALVVKRGKRPARPTLAPPSSCGSDLYRRIKRRLERTFRRLYRKRWFVRAGKPSTYQFPRIESSFIGSKDIRTSLLGSGSSSCHRQYYCGSLHKQRRRHAFRISMCSPVETPVFVQSQRNLPESMSHSRLSQCDSRQTVPTPSSHSDGMASSPG